MVPQIFKISGLKPVIDQYTINGKVKLSKWISNMWFCWIGDISEQWHRLAGRIFIDFKKAFDTDNYNVNINWKF